MSSVREAWTDERLDDFARNVNQRFDRVESKIEDGFRELRKEWNAMHRAIVQFAAVMIGAVVGLIATQLGLILTQI
jgi:tetrahydromethanopterin S-methyltransferase subunit G